MLSCSMRWRLFRQSVDREYLVVKSDFRLKAYIETGTPGLIVAESVTLFT